MADIYKDWRSDIMRRWLQFWRRRDKRQVAETPCRAAGYMIRIARRDHDSWEVCMDSDHPVIVPRDWCGALCVHVCKLAMATGLEPDQILDAAREQINSPLTMFREGLPGD